MLKILVGTDFGPSSRRALDQATWIADRADGFLEVVHVVPSKVSAMTELVDTAPERLADVPSSVRALADECHTAALQRVAARAHLRLGDPGTALLDAIVELEPDLVVVESHQRGAVARTFLGSVSEKVWRESRVPVLIVKPDEAQVEKRAARPPTELAWACFRCGHIRANVEGWFRCQQCGADPAAWIWAVMTHEPVDTLDAAVGHGAAEQERAGAPADATAASLFATAPAGAEGYDVNPELRVRY